MAAPGSAPSNDSAPTLSGGTTRTIATSVIPSLAPGSVLGGRFTIIRFIARGGMGEVYEAADLHLQGKRLALKTLLPEFVADQKARQRFEREVLTAREIHHPNVCPTYDIFREDSQLGRFLFLTMKLLDGVTLNAILKQTGPLPIDIAIPLLRQMAAGLDAAHSAGVVHRDFKPGNVIIDANQHPPHATITDFGISRLHTTGHTLTGSGNVIGTPGYIAPEIMRGERPGPPSDIYAFGLVMTAIIADPLPSLWQQVIKQCLDPDPTMRPATAGAAVEALEPPRPAVIVEKSPQASVSRRKLLIWGGASAALAATGGALYEWRPWLTPLPAKRFVALMPWPAAKDDASRGLVRNVLDAIESRLTQAERGRDFLVISSADPRNPGLAPAEPAKAGGELGANLVLAASLSGARSDEYEVGLQVLDSSNSRVLREGSVRAAFGELLDKASALAARLLDVPVVHAASTDEDELASLKPDALKLFTEAEGLMAQPNDSGLDAAIERYQKAIESAPKFALGHAAIALAYLRQFTLTRNPALTAVADNNVQIALRSNPASAKAQLASALVSLNAGHIVEANDALVRLQQADPSNVLYPYYRAVALRKLHKPEEEMAVYRQIVRDRALFWPAYNELGHALHRAGRDADAAKAFAEANAVAPRAALPLANLGATYDMLGKKSEAIDALRQSLDRAPSWVAYSNLGTLYFEAHDYAAALAAYKSACDLKPRDGRNWRNLADCQTRLGNGAAAADAYSKAAAVALEDVRVDPSLGPVWMTLAFYRAKTGDREGCDRALREGESNGAFDVDSLLFKAQALAVTGRREDALNLVITLVKRGLPPSEVDLALDLDPIRQDPRYQAALKEKSR